MFGHAIIIGKGLGIADNSFFAVALKEISPDRRYAGVVQKIQDLL